MIDLGSIAGLLRHDHELRAYCVKCARWSVLDLATMVRDGHGDRRLPLSVRCRDCGEPGQLQVRPPMPAWTNTNGWRSA
jgi:RNase P subunit RPR2